MNNLAYLVFKIIANFFPLGKGKYTRRLSLSH